MYQGDISLKVAKLKKGFAIVSGYNILKKFKTEQEARVEIDNNASFYEYWAKSASAMLINSYTSLCLAYAGNKVNLDVLDFRDGESRTYFARKIDDVIKLAGGFVEKDYNDFKAINKLLKNVEIDKEYILSTGRHASIIRKSKERGWEYLELQSPSSNGYKPLDNKKLQSRFDCKKSRTHYGQKIELVSSLIDIEKLNTEDFKTLLGYINTEGTMQKKGERGRTR